MSAEPHGITQTTTVDVDGLMTALNINHKPEEWRLFIDSSK
jgi:hypothetical protein